LDPEFEKSMQKPVVSDKFMNYVKEIDKINDRMTNNMEKSNVKEIKSYLKERLNKKMKKMLESKNISYQKNEVNSNILKDPFN